MKLRPLIEAMRTMLLIRPVLYADETPVPNLKPGLGKIHPASPWSFSTSEYDELQGVVYDCRHGVRSAIGRLRRVVSRRRLGAGMLIAELARSRIPPRRLELVTLNS